MNIERMRWWDVDAIMPIEAALFTDTAWSAGQFWSELAHVPNSRAYVVARDGDEILGYAGVYTNAPTADVQTIAVAPHAQRRGVGATLLHALADASRERGCTELLLEVRADNDPAIALYETNGFEVIATRRGYYGPGVDAKIMRKRPV